MKVSKSIHSQDILMLSIHNKTDMSKDIVYSKLQNIKEVF